MKNGWKRALGIVGVILVLIIGLWGVFSLAKHAPGLFANIGRFASAPFSSKFDRSQTAAVAETETTSQDTQPAATTKTQSPDGGPLSPAVKTTVQVPKKPTSIPAGYVDLSVRILSTARGGAQFEIKNNGTKTAPAGWTFSASLPLPTPYTYTSDPQQALPPQGYIINNLGWAPPPATSNCSQFQTTPGYQPYPAISQMQNCTVSSYQAGGTFTVYVDQQNVTGDNNSTNNTASAVINN